MILALFNVLLPIAILALLPKLFNAPWFAILAYGPGIGHFLLFLPVSLLIVGIAKIVLLRFNASQLKHHKIAE
jgi:hypothetical protein